MKRTYRMLALLPLLLKSVAAQETERLRLDAEKLRSALKKVEVSYQAGLVGGAVMGAAVKNAPYSGIEVTENTQVLGDGTRIHNEYQTMVYRDSEGRVRRETAESITIWDPVANASYFLDPKAQVAKKLPLGMAVATSRGGFGVTMMAGSGPNTVSFTSSGPLESGGQVAFHGAPALMVGPVAKSLSVNGPNANFESLGQQVIEGVKSDGNRVTSTIEAGEIGNDRPIQSVTETWYSSELQTAIKTVRTDPRMGDMTFRLTNISRAEPAAYLFQIPAGYQVSEGK